MFGIRTVLRSSSLVRTRTLQTRVSQAALSRYTTSADQEPWSPLEILETAAKGYLTCVSVDDLLAKRGKKVLVECKSEDTLATALEHMKKANVGSILVMEGPLNVGIFTEKDHLTKLSGRNPNDVQISEIMSGNVIVSTGDASLAEAMRTMVSNNIRHLPIVKFEGDALDMDSRVVDVLSSRDLFSFLL